MADVVIAKAGPASILPEPLTLGGTSNFIITGSTEVTATANPLLIAPNNQLIFGSLKTVTSASFAPTTGDVIVLRVKAME